MFSNTELGTIEERIEVNVKCREETVFKDFGTQVNERLWSVVGDILCAAFLVSRDDYGLLRLCGYVEV